MFAALVPQRVSFSKSRYPRTAACTCQDKGPESCVIKFDANGEGRESRHNPNTQEIALALSISLWPQWRGEVTVAWEASPGNLSSFCAGYGKSEKDVIGEKREERAPQPILSAERDIVSPGCTCFKLVALLQKGMSEVCGQE